VISLALAILTITAFITASFRNPGYVR